MSESAHLVRRWGARDLPDAGVVHGIRLRALRATDSTELGHLLWAGFGMGGPDGYDSEDAALREASETMGGKWGPVIWEASLIAFRREVGVAASVVVRDDHHQFLPLLAFLVTDPAHQGHGVARSLIAETIAHLDVIGIRELHLSVSNDNPARRLYSQMGFKSDRAIGQEDRRRSGSS